MQFDAPMPPEPDEFEVELARKVVDALRPLGLTVDNAMMSKMIDPESNKVMTVFQFTAMVRESAKEKILEDETVKQDFLKMMQDDSNARIQGQKEEILKGMDNLEDILFGDDEDDEACCDNFQPHPVSGFCINCGHGMEA